MRNDLRLRGIWQAIFFRIAAKIVLKGVLSLTIYFHLPTLLGDMRVLILMFLMVLPASASAGCGLRDRVLALLAGHYSEYPVAAREVDDGLWELHGGAHGGWTITVTREGRTCLVSSGRGWRPYVNASHISLAPVIDKST
ncbi:hypothetical protein [Halodurantibacterium flavum]|uniref:Uncharacterized protein n=1 Tax=Halodurantibacterium flavum TaxID=1382802 RepID=A0ABW4S487_9RHOB